MRTDWRTVETVLIPAIRCPACSAGEPVIVRTEACGDGAITRKCVCHRCSTKFKVCVDPEIPADVLPAAGNDDFDVL